MKTHIYLNPKIRPSLLSLLSPNPWMYLTYGTSLGTVGGPEPIKFIAPVLCPVVRKEGCSVWKMVDISGKHSQ